MRRGVVARCRRERFFVDDAPGGMERAPDAERDLWRWKTKADT